MVRVFHHFIVSALPISAHSQKKEAFVYSNMWLVSKSVVGCSTLSDCLAINLWAFFCDPNWQYWAFGCQIKAYFFLTQHWLSSNIWQLIRSLLVLRELCRDICCNQSNRVVLECPLDTIFSGKFQYIGSTKIFQVCPLVFLSFNLLIVLQWNEFSNWASN